MYDCSRHAEQHAARIRLLRAQPQNETRGADEPVGDRENFHRQQRSRGIRIPHVSAVDVGPPRIGPRGIARGVDRVVEQQPAKLPAQVREVGDDHEDEADGFDALKARPRPERRKRPERGREAREHAHRVHDCEQVRGLIAIRAPPEHRRRSHWKRERNGSERQRARNPEVGVTLRVRGHGRAWGDRLGHREVSVGLCEVAHYSRHVSTSPPWPMSTVPGNTRNRHASSFSAANESSVGFSHTGIIAGS